MYTSCISESRYWMSRALLTRGYQACYMSDGYRFKVFNTTGKFTLTFMPGNRRVIISSGVEIYPHLRGKGWGKRGLLDRECIAREVGCNLILATVKNNNAVEIHLLETNGWKRMLNRSETEVSLWGKEL